MPTKFWTNKKPTINRLHDMFFMSMSFCWHVPTNWCDVWDGIRCISNEHFINAAYFFPKILESEYTSWWMMCTCTIAKNDSCISVSFQQRFFSNHWILRWYAFQRTNLISDLFQIIIFFCNEQMIRIII